MSSPIKKALDQNPQRVLPFVVNQLPLHNHVIQLIGGKSYNFTQDQSINLDRHISDIIIPPQTPPPTTFFLSNSNFFSFKIQSDRYAVRRSFLEFDVTNTSASAVQLVPGPFLVDFLRFRTGNGALIQELRGEDLWHDLCASYDTDRLTGLASTYNIDPSTFGANQTIAAGATATVSLPMIGSFLDQLHFFMGALNQTGLELQVYSRGAAAMLTGASSDISVGAARLRFRAEFYSGKATDQKTTDEKKVVHHWKFLNSITQRQSIGMTVGNTYTPQLQSLNGLVPYVWFGLRSSLTGAGLYTWTAIGDYELLDSQNQSLQNGVRITDAVARYEIAPENFDSELFTVMPIVPVCHVENPMVLLSHPVNTGAQWYSNNFLSVKAASTGTYNIDVYAKRWAVLELDVDGNLRVLDN